MKKEVKIAIFEGKKIRREWDDKRELWLFSVIDIVETLTGSSIPKRYWTDLKRKLKEEGSEVYEKIVQLKMEASDGKLYLTDVAGKRGGGVGQASARGVLILAEECDTINA